MSRARPLALAAGGVAVFGGSVAAGYFATRVCSPSCSCGKCGGGGGAAADATKPMPAYAERLSAYDAGAATYDGSIGWDEWVMGVDSQRRQLCGKARGSVLECAAGTGRNAWCVDCHGCC